MSSPESRQPPPDDSRPDADRPAEPPAGGGAADPSAADAADLAGPARRPPTHPPSGIDPAVLAEAGLTEEDMFRDEGQGERWDKDDPRRKDDSFAPPTEPCECHCLHCGRTFSSEGIWFQQVINDPQGFKGFWMCPTPNCSGAGFTFDIFPTDPDHPANEGWHYDDDDDGLDAEGEADGDEDEDDDHDEEAWADDPALTAPADEHDEYDPDETKYKQLDEFYGDDEDDLEGEEWKHGLQPGERPPEPAWREGARREWEEDQKKYDAPDQRPRQLDWSDREDRHQFNDDDIPF